MIDLAPGPARRIRSGAAQRLCRPILPETVAPVASITTADSGQRKRRPGLDEPPELVRPVILAVLVGAHEVGKGV